VPHSKGFRHRKDERTLQETAIGDVVDGLLKERAFARGLPIGQLSSGWADVVGPRLAAESRRAPGRGAHRFVSWPIRSAFGPTRRSGRAASPRSASSSGRSHGKVCSARVSGLRERLRKTAETAFGVTPDW
jgi:hypothetical protein